jgi:hypothetical protein
MRLPRIRFAVRRLKIVVALIAINLAALLAVLARYQIGNDIGMGPPENETTWGHGPDGSF